MCPRVNDTIQLVQDVPEESLKRGAIGVVVARFFNPDEAYEIEFSGPDGATILQIALKSDRFVIVGESPDRT